MLPFFKTLFSFFFTTLMTILDPSRRNGDGSSSGNSNNSSSSNNGGVPVTQARDTTRLELLVCLIFSFIIFLLH
jgi:hypothetical protein